MATVTVKVVAEPRWSYREASRLFGCDHHAIGGLARAHGLVREGRNPLDAAGLIRIGELLNYEVEIPLAS